MEKIPWYKSNTIRALAVAALMQVVAATGLAEQFDAEAVGKYVDAGLDLVTFFATVYAMWSRSTQPTPPLTDIAVVRTIDRDRQQGGRATVAMLTFVGCVAALAGCTGLQMAWKSADTLDKQAYVLVEQYSSLVKEAADLAEKPTTPNEVKDALKNADNKARPVVLRLREVRDAYRAIDSAENAEALQKAVNDAVLLITDMVNVLKRAKGEG